jgi:hypothetical protein
MGYSSWPSIEDFAKLGTSILVAKSPSLLQQFEIVLVRFGTSSIWCKTPNFSCFRGVFRGCRCRLQVVVQLGITLYQHELCG